MDELTDAEISALAREAYEESLRANGDHGMAHDAAVVAIRECVSAERTGFFDAETLTWTSDEVM